MPLGAAADADRRRHRHGDDAEAAASIDAFVKQPAGLSTLDLLRRRPSSAATTTGASVNSKLVGRSSLPKDVRREMSALASAELRKQQRLAKNAERVVGLDLNRLGLRSDEDEQRVLIARFLAASMAPAERQLVGGRLMRESELVELRSSLPSSLSLSLGVSKSTPSLRRTAAASSASESVKTETETQSRRRRCREEGKEVEDGEAGERAALRRREELLHKELLHVTHKMCRKYSRRLAPVDGSSPSATHSRTQDLAGQWTSIQRQQQTEGADDGLAMDRRRHAAFVAGRFSTQNALDYYPRELEPREPGSDRHRRHTAHTKYGDALARTRKSLRGPF